MKSIEEVFCSKEVWDKILYKALFKTIPSFISQAFCSERTREEFFLKFLEGEYKFNPPHLAVIPKDNGGLREIFVYGGLDRLVLSAYNEALNIVYGKDMVSPACMAYIEGRSTLRTVKEVLSSTEVRSGFKADLTSYFTSIPQEDVLGMMDKTGQGTKLSEMVKQVYLDKSVVVDEKLVEMEKGVGQGCALAAFLSNAYLFEVDEAMRKRYPTYKRYSDDIIVLTENPDEAFEYLKELMAKYTPKLELNPSKVQIFDGKSSFTFLGWDIDGEHIRLSQKHMNRLKATLKHKVNPNILRVKHAKRNKEYLRKAVQAAMKFLYFNVEVNGKNFGFANQSILGMTDEEEVKELSMYIRNRILKEYTGKFSTHENSCVKEELLRSFGYISLYDMWKRNKIHPSLFDWSVLKLKNFFKYGPGEKHDRVSSVEELWSALNNLKAMKSLGQRYGYYFFEGTSNYNGDAYKEVMNCIRNLDPGVFENNPYWFFSLNDAMFFKGEMDGFPC